MAKYLRDIDMSPSKDFKKRAQRKASLDDFITKVFEQNAKSDAVTLKGAEIILTNSNDLTDPAEYDTAISALEELSANLYTGAAKSVAKAYGTALTNSKKSAISNNHIMDSLTETESALNALYSGGQWQTSDALVILDNLKSVSNDFRPKANKQVRKALDAKLGDLSDTVALAEMFAGVDKDPDEPGVQHYNQDIRSGWAHFLTGNLKLANTRLDAGKKKVSADNWQKWEDQYTRNRASLDDIFNKHIKAGVNADLFSDIQDILPTQKVGSLHVDTLVGEQKNVKSALNKILMGAKIENKVAKARYNKSGAEGFIIGIMGQAYNDEIDVRDPIAFASWLEDEMNFKGWDIFNNQHEGAGAEVMGALLRSYVTLDEAWDELSSSSGISPSKSASSANTSAGIFGPII